MKLIKTQHKKSNELMPIAKKPAKISSYKFMCAILYIIEDSCKWMELQKEYEMWHIIYIKFIRWSKNGTMTKAIAFFL